jgi:aldehyde dehydrogenase (NAD+)
MTVIAVFGAVGTAGQRCTSTRRLIIHESIYDKVRDALVSAYGQLRQESIRRKQSRGSTN